MRKIEVDVLVVGIGPAGLTAAGFLASYGLNVLALSKYGGAAPTPRSTFANARSMEVYADLGCVKEVQAEGVYLPSTANSVFATSFVGPELARLRSYGTAPERMSDYETASPYRNWNVPQHLLEPVLAKRARELGADVRYSNEMLQIAQSADEVSARILDKVSGEEYLVRAKYAIGADGGRSKTAELLGIPFEGQEVFGNIVSLWVEADLEKYTAYRPGYIYSMVCPGPSQMSGMTGWLSVKPWNEWLLSLPNATSETPESELLARAHESIGDPDVRIRIKQTYSWQVSHLYATRYRDHRILLAGDAAHRHPPWGGLGANTSMQDAFNLAWKLAYVIKGWAGVGLLESYHDERQPVGRHVVERANKSLRSGQRILEELGLRENQPVDEAWALINGLFDDNAAAASRRQKFRESLDVINFRANASGVELGQRYTSSAIVNNGMPFPAYTRDPDLYYHPTTHPGAYLPHAWVEKDRRQYSTVELVGKNRFSLIVGIGGRHWLDAARRASAELGIELAVLSIGAGCEYGDVYGDWTDRREVGDHGAILVRPDRHVAWRSMALLADPPGALSGALRQILDR